jgi:hypothetical protein
MKSWDEALQASIEAWKLKLKLILDHNFEVLREMICPLCRFRKDTDANCRECPVGMLTGKEGCYGTPYYAWSDELSRVSHKEKGTIEYAKAYSKLIGLTLEEIEFLENIPKPGINFTKLKKGDRIICQGTDRRYFASYDAERKIVRAFASGRDEWSSEGRTVECYEGDVTLPKEIE